jgi:small subunit ribosomal protein S7
MPRRAKKVQRRVLPRDARYASVTVAKLVNKVMLDGKKATAERIVYDALRLASERLSDKPAEVLDRAMGNATPLLMVKSRRVGGATYQVPVEVKLDRGRSLAMKWLIASARARSGKSMVEKLAAELVDAANRQGATIKKRDDVHKMAEANKAFAHYRW